jgi:hypothetical protein
MLTVPIAFATMVLVSLRGLPPPGTRGHMLALHAPEGLGLEARGRALAERPEARV